MFLASSSFCTPCLIARRQARRSSAQLYHVLILMLHSFMSVLQRSLKRRRGRPVGHEPSASSPYRRFLGMRPGSILLTWPRQRRRLSLRIVNMLFISVGTIQDLCVGNFVLPLDVQNASQAPQVEAVEFPLLARVGGPCLAAVEEYTEHTGLVDVHFGLHSATGVIPDPMLQSGHNCSCLGNPAFHLCINGERAGDGGPEVSEVLHSFQVVSINGDGWRIREIDQQLTTSAHCVEGSFPNWTFQPHKALFENHQSERDTIVF